METLEEEVGKREESVNVLRKTIEQREQLYSELNMAYIEQSQ